MMSFPSSYLKRWFEHINRVAESYNCGGRIPADIRYFKPFPFPLLPGEKIDPSAFDPDNRQIQVLITAFWGSWIDEVLQKVGDAELYKCFTAKYPFPHVEICQHHVPLSWYLDRSVIKETSPARKRYLIKKYKDVFWGDVQAWLESIGREEIRDKAIKAFQEYEFTELGNLSPFEGD